MPPIRRFAVNVGWTAAYLALYIGVIGYLYGYKRFTVAGGYAIPEYLVLTACVAFIVLFLVPVLTGPLKKWPARHALEGLLVFFLLVGFSWACSGAGLRWAWSRSPLGSLSFFFSEFNFLQFWFVAAPILSIAAGFYFWLVQRRART